MRIPKIQDGGRRERHIKFRKTNFNLKIAEGSVTELHGDNHNWSPYCPHRQKSHFLKLKKAADRHT